MAETVDSPDVIRLAGPQTIATAAATRATLLAGLRPGHAIQLDCAAATSFDIGFVQLLVAARRQAEMQGGSLALLPGHAASLDDILAEAGLAGWATATLEEMA